MEKKGERSNFGVLVFGFLGMIALGVVAMVVVGFLNAKDYKANLSAAVQSFEDLEIQTP